MKARIVLRTTLLGALAVAIGACAESSQGPTAWLDQPLDNSTHRLGPIILLAHASDADGVGSFEFCVDDTFLATLPAAGDRLGEAVLSGQTTTLW